VHGIVPRTAPDGKFFQSEASHNRFQLAQSPLLGACWHLSSPAHTTLPLDRLEPLLEQDLSFGKK
jgi:hypothetical protein